MQCSNELSQRGALDLHVVGELKVTVHLYIADCPFGVNTTVELKYMTTTSDTSGIMQYTIKLNKYIAH
jgi:hypothetical protein